MTFVPLTPDERAEMLARIGVGSVEELFRDVPERVRFPQLDLPPALTELEASRHLAGLAGQNVDLTRLVSFLGAGAYFHHVPAAVDSVLARNEFYTAYTPYQAEMSQGTLQFMFEFQSLVCDLLGMEVANASVYDGPSALAEAVLMAQRVTRRDRVVLSGGVHPQWRDAVAAYLAGRDLSPVVTAVERSEGRLRVEPVTDLLDAETACIVVQQPDFFGGIQDLAGLADAAHEQGALLIVAVAEAVSLGLLKPPGAWGADVAVAEGQSLGVPLQYGGPWVGLMATKHEHLRQLPGRIVGQTVDEQGRRGFVLTLQAREQHIRREKATSNICTSETLLALAVTAYLTFMGPSGLREAARQSHARAVYAADRIAALPGYSILTPRPFFDEFVVACPAPARQVRDDLLAGGVLAGYPLGRDLPGLDDCLLVCCTEMNTRDQIDRLVDGLAGAAK